jgi:hypothetical protein
MRSLAATLVLLLCLAAVGRAQVEPEPGIPPPPAPIAFADDNHAVRFILSKYVLKTRPLQSFDELDPRRSVLIVLGSTARLDDLKQFRDFVGAGGSVLIATDQDTANIVQRVLRVRVVGGEPVKARDPADAYRGQPECPLITEFNTSYSLFQNVEKIATYRAGQVEATARSRAIAVAPFPASCRRPNEKAIPTFAMLHERELPDAPVQRILVLSDQSLFINGMMLQKDNDNFGFALNALRWICDAEDGPAQRNQVLLIQDGRIEDSFDVKVKAAPSAMPSDLPKDLPAHPVDLINGLLADWEDKNYHNEIILNGASWRQILSVAAIVLSIALIAYGLYRVQMAHNRVETG